MGKLLELTLSPKNRAAILDEFGEVTRRRREFQPVEKRFEQLSAEIAGWYTDKPVAEEYVAKGDRWQVEISARTNVRTVDMKRARKKLGSLKLLSICSATIKALKSILPEAEAEELLTESQTGYRRLTATPILSPIAQAVVEPIDQAA